jgi:hypothetical protein
MTAGGDKLDYPGDASSPAISMLDAKLHINSTISDAKNGARYMYLGLDIKNFYLDNRFIIVTPKIKNDKNKTGSSFNSIFVVRLGLALAKLKKQLSRNQKTTI